MNKISEDYEDNEIYKTYSYDENMDIKNFINDLKETDYIIRKVMVDEGVESDMQTISGTYSYDNFYQNLEKIGNILMSYEQGSITTLGNYNGVEAVITVIPYEKIINLCTTERDLEITDIIKKNEKTY